jgi:Zn-dependent M28 family amino/carboxypeptidase
MLAVVNMDGANFWGRTRDVTIAGERLTTIDDLLRELTKTQGRTFVVRPDEKGFFYRSDHVEFAKVGIPAVFPVSGLEVRGKPEGYAEKSGPSVGRKIFIRSQTKSKRNGI